MTYQVIGRKADGSTVYYTGKAGQAFVSEHSADAFGFDTLEYARHRAMVLNRTMELHGVRFIVPCGECERPLLVLP
jgi:hypothetical protein